MKSYLFLVLTLLLPSTLWAQSSAFCNSQELEMLASLPILQGGRVKPLIVHVDETLGFLATKKSYKDDSLLKVYCLLSLSTFDYKLMVKVEHKDTRSFFGMAEGQKEIAMDDLVAKMMDMRGYVIRTQESTPVKKELEKQLSRAQAYQDITNGTNWVVPEKSLAQTSESNPLGNWIPLKNFLESPNLTEAAKSADAEAGAKVQDSLLKTRENYVSTFGEHYLLELRYYKYKPFKYALYLCLIALALHILVKNPLYGTLLALLSIFIQVGGMVMRIMISGRAPVTNMYETVMFSGLGALILAVIISLYKKERIYITVGLCYNFCCLMMMNFANGMLSPSIAPLVPVLRDNFWLSTHVTTVTLSYGAFALSWVMANMVLVQRRFMSLTQANFVYYTNLIYTCLKYGTIMLAAGLILGGVWADYSWGRFWGWDPKETWSLIVLCIYMAILHGKSTSWIPMDRFVPLVALAFLSVMMAWFGVNYILAAGLHSYGFSEGGAIFLGTFFAAQITLVVLTGFRIRVANN